MCQPKFDFNNPQQFVDELKLWATQLQARPPSTPEDIASCPPELLQEMLDDLEKVKFLRRMHAQNGEKRACSVFDHLFSNGCLPTRIDDGEGKMSRELRFKNTGKKVDRAIFHPSGRLTLIELKDFADERAIVAGIGQVQWYAAMAEAEYSNAPVVPALAVLGSRDDNVARACQRAGVEYFPMGPLRAWRILSMAMDLAGMHALPGH